jgi:hypothetical protein
MRIRFTAVEKLDAENPGLRFDIDALLRRDATQEEIQSALQEKYGLLVPLPQISKYKQKRWIPETQRIRDYIERLQAMVEVVEKEFCRTPAGNRRWRRSQRPAVIMIAASELFGLGWPEVLRTGLLHRFQVPEAVDLSATQAQAEVEGLVSRLALVKRENPESVRDRISAKIRGNKHD